MDPTQRFSNRVEDYVRYRPSYPDALVRAIQARAALTPASRIADAGSGTGISAELFLRLGCTVDAIEPNAGMRAAAERRLGHHPTFRSVEGTAEQTTLPDASVDLVTAAQAFHWFDVDAVRREWARILRPDGLAAVFWNRRRHDDTAFARGYEDLLQRYGTDYRAIIGRSVDMTRIEGLFGGSVEPHVFPNAQAFDLDGLTGRLLSSSYAPPPGHPDHDPMLRELAVLFAVHARQGLVTFTYDTQLYIGTLTAG